MRAVVRALGFAALLLRPAGVRAGGDDWHRSIDPARCDSAEAIEYPPTQRWIRHRLVPGESLAQVAARYGVREADLRAHNGIDSRVPTLVVGATLRVKARRVPPPRREVLYTAREGDSWASVARAHGVSSKQLRAHHYTRERGWHAPLREGTALRIWVDPVVHDWLRAGRPDDTIARGGVGIGAPDTGELRHGVAIPEGEGYTLRFPDASFGTSHAVGELVRALADFRARTDYEGTLELGTMSREHGGALGDHRSHRTGRDLDIALPRRVDVPGWMPLTPRRVDWRALWDLALALAEVDATVVYLDYTLQRDFYRAMRAEGVGDEALRRILQYPRGHKANLGLVRHAPGHDTHVHVRFGCGPCETECIELGAWAGGPAR
ncbi:MAG: LysM peptidoglycan-binding domain-containing protein [Nannocystaceae bacterium]|nr:LysM peptidoglycan-binding domain-containing protein [Nannocystaceae bacterium]